MRIVHVTECLAGGVLTFLLNLTQALDTEEHVIIFSRRDNTPDYVETLFGSNVKLVPWKYAGREIRPKQDFLALLELMKLLQQYPNADVVQLHSSKAGFLGRVACRLLGRTKKVFYLPHGLSFAREDVSERKKQFYTYLEKIGNAFCGEVIACSNSEKDLLLKKGIRNVHVINNGIKAANELPKYREFSYPLVIGTTGRLTGQKNPALFNEIARAFRGDTRVRFSWIGDGELRNEIETADNIEITGWLTPQEVQNQLRSVDLYMSTALWEGLPYAVLEAMNLGKPLLLSACIGNVDLVRNGENGYLYHTVGEAINRIQEILQRSDDLISMGKRSYQYIKDGFSIEIMKANYRELYQGFGIQK